MLPCLLKIMMWGNKKPFPPAVEKRASLYAFLGTPEGIDPSPVSPLVQASAPRAVRGLASATLGKPLIREYLFYPTDVFGCRQGSGLCVAREPRLPRMSRGLTNSPRQSQPPTRPAPGCCQLSFWKVPCDCGPGGRWRESRGSPGSRGRNGAERPPNCGRKSPG